MFSSVLQFISGLFATMQFYRGIVDIFVAMKKVYVLLKDKRLEDFCTTSLKDLCESYGLGYYSAVRGKLIFVVDGSMYEIVELRVNRIKGRGKSF